MVAKRTKATDVSNKVRKIVKERDKWCIFCGKTGHQMCHVRPRSKGGLGIEQNIVYGCVHCHTLLDQSSRREEMVQYALDYLECFYPDFDDKERYFDKWRWLDVS